MCWTICEVELILSKVQIVMLSIERIDESVFDNRLEYDSIIVLELYQIGKKSKLPFPQKSSCRMRKFKQWQFQNKLTYIFESMCVCTYILKSRIYKYQRVEL